MRTRTPTLYLDFRLKPGSSHTQEVEEGWTAFIYILEGRVRVGQVDWKNVIDFIDDNDLT